MEILGVGPTELLFIVIIALILLGPREMGKAGHTIGKWLNDLVKSDTWQVMRDTSKLVSGLPTRLMREANLEEMKKEADINSALRDLNSEIQTPAQTENQILPPRSLSYTPGQPPASKAPKKAVKKTTSKKPAATKKQSKPKTAKSKAGKNTNA